MVLDVLVSVIIPVYKVENFVHRCINSVLNQTYAKLEIIIVVDLNCDIDNSGNICKEIAKTDNRIRIYDQKNRGLSGARNDALEIAKGEYIMFIDGDDYIDEHMIENMLYEANENDAELVIGRYIECAPGQNVEYNRRESKIISKHDAFEIMVDSDNGVFLRTAWGKLYKKSLIKQFRYKEHSYNEDMLIIHEILLAANKIVLDETVYYYYVQNADSLDRSAFNIGKTMYVEAARMWMEYIKETFPDIYNKSVWFYVEAISNMTMMLLTLEDSYDKDRLLKEYSIEMNKYSYIWLNSKHFSTIKKVQLYFISHRYWWICRFVNKIKGR